MCTTTERRQIKDDIVACRWSSCSEWCLSKGGGACTHLYVRDVVMTSIRFRSRFILELRCHSKESSIGPLKVIVGKTFAVNVTESNDKP